MKVENPAAFRFIMQDDIFLLDTDKQPLTPAVEFVPIVAEAPAAIPVPAAPVNIAPQAPAIPTIPALPVMETKPQTAPSAPPQPVDETQNAAFNYLGNNQKQFLVLVNYPADPFMQDNHLAALEATLKRKGLVMDDVAVLNIANYPGIPFKQIKSYFLPARVLALGAAALPPGLPIKFHQQQTAGPITALLTFAFDEMMASNDNKKAFWDQVKNF